MMSFHQKLMLSGLVTLTAGSCHKSEPVTISYLGSKTGQEVEIKVHKGLNLEEEDVEDFMDIKLNVESIHITKNEITNQDGKKFKGGNEGGKRFLYFVELYLKEKRGMKSGKKNDAIREALKAQIKQFSVERKKVNQKHMNNQADKGVLASAMNNKDLSKRYLYVDCQIPLLPATWYYQNPQRLVKFSKISTFEKRLPNKVCQYLKKENASIDLKNLSGGRLNMEFKKGKDNTGYCLILKFNEAYSGHGEAVASKDSLPPIDENTELTENEATDGSSSDNGSSSAGSSGGRTSSSDDDTISTPPPATTPPKKGPPAKGPSKPKKIINNTQQGGKEFSWDESDDEEDRKEDERIAREKEMQKQADKSEQKIDTQRKPREWSEAKKKESEMLIEKYQKEEEARLELRNLLRKRGAYTKKTVRASASKEYSMDGWKNPTMLQLPQTNSHVLDLEDALKKIKYDLGSDQAKRQSEMARNIWNQSHRKNKRRVGGFEVNMTEEERAEQQGKAKRDARSIKNVGNVSAFGKFGKEQLTLLTSD